MPFWAHEAVDTILPFKAFMTRRQFFLELSHLRASFLTFNRDRTNDLFRKEETCVLVINEAIYGYGSIRNNNRKFVICSFF